MTLPKILLVDDVEFFLQLEKDFLRNTPATVLTARNGQEALDVAGRQRPDLIFMDVVMPVMDGITCCRAIKADPQLQKTPVVMVFAPGREITPEEATAAGGDGVLTKPVSRLDFLETGRRFLLAVERRGERVPCQALITLRRQGEKFHCTGEDLSEGGVYVKSMEPLAEGEVVRATMLLPDRRATVLECRARVAWVNQAFPRVKPGLPQGFGLEFLHPSGALVTAIRDFIARQRSH